jgi:hypothetical protein
MSVLVTKQEMSGHYGCSYRAVQEWCNAPNFPGGRDGPWETDDVDKYLHSRQSPYAPGARDKPGRASVNGNDRAGRVHSTARALVEQEKHRRLRILNDKLEGQLEYSDAAKRVWNIGMTKIKARLESVPEIVEALVPDESRKAVR